MALLDVRNLSVSFQTRDGRIDALSGISVFVNPAEAVAIVGESGAGKTQIALAILGLLAGSATQGGEVTFDGQRIDGQPAPALNKIRAAKIGMIFQDPVTALNPYLRISRQMSEGLILHKGISRREAESEAVRMLDVVRVPGAKAILHCYPHQLPVGLRQRVVIAMALLCRPKLLILDEPTRGLDVTERAQIISLLSEIRRDFHAAMLLLTDNLGEAARLCARTMVLYGGQMMESGGTESIFARPTHPYTKGLLNAVPRLDVDGAALPEIKGVPPKRGALAEGCPFQPRCRDRIARCATVRPVLQSVDGRHLRACHVDAKGIA